MRNKEEIIDYLGLDYENKNKEWWKPTINVAMEIEKEFEKELENENVGYGLTCYFDNKYQRGLLEDLKKYNLIKIKEVLGITIYRKEVR